MSAPAHVHMMSWAAGVLDAAGVFRLRQREGQPFAAVVEVRCGEDTGNLLYSTLAAGKWRDGKWRVPAKEQEWVLGLVMPYLRTKYEEANRVYRFRLVGPRRRIGWRVTPAVRRFRESLVRDVREIGRFR